MKFLNGKWALAATNDAAKAGLALAAVATLAACVMVPVTHEVYDPACGTVRREVVLQPQMIGPVAGCVGRDCTALLAGMGVVTAASAVVSGSIAVVGNVAYWLEHKAQCRAGAASAVAVEAPTLPASSTTKAPAPP